VDNLRKTAEKDPIMEGYSQPSGLSLEFDKKKFLTTKPRLFTGLQAQNCLVFHSTIHKNQGFIRVFCPSYPQCYAHRGFIRACQWWMLDKLVPPTPKGALDVTGACFTGRTGAIK
jgi:hypothetical protein